MINLQLINNTLISLDYGMESYIQDPPNSDNVEAIMMYKAIVFWQKEVRLLSSLINTESCGEELNK